MNDVIDMSIKSSSDLSSESRVAMLNADQQHIYDKMKSHLLHQQQHEEMSLRGRETTTNVCQWHWRYRKLFLIQTIKASIADILANLRLAVAAPTGSAAFSITTHRLFQRQLSMRPK